MQSCLQNISKICVEEPYTEEYPCYPDYLKEIGPYFGIWCLFISFLGMFGNLLTMLAIPFAANRKKYVMLYLMFETYQMKYFVNQNQIMQEYNFHCRFGLHKQTRSSIFVLNLAFADFVYCTFCLPISSTSYFTKAWVLGPVLCYISGK